MVDMNALTINDIQVGDVIRSKKDPRLFLCVLSIDDKGFYGPFCWSVLGEDSMRQAGQVALKNIPYWEKVELSDRN